MKLQEVNLQNPLFVKLKCLKDDDINFLQTAIFVFRFNTKLLPDSLFFYMFQSNNAVHSYSTRQASNIHLVNPRTTLAHKSIRHSGPDVWNSLPQHVRTLQTPHSFKRAIKRILISKMCWIFRYISLLYMSSMFLSSLLFVICCCYGYSWYLSCCFLCLLIGYCIVKI